MNLILELSKDLVNTVRTSAIRRKLLVSIVGSYSRGLDALPCQFNSGEQKPLG